MNHIEVQQEAQLRLTEFQIAQQLGVVNRHQVLDCFDLDDNFPANPQIN